MDIASFQLSLMHHLHTVDILFFLLVFIFILKQMLILTSGNQYMSFFLLLNCSTNTKQWWFMLVNVILKLVCSFLTANVVADIGCSYSC